MIKIRSILRLGSRQEIELILLKLLNGLNCSLYLFNLNLPTTVYKKIMLDLNTNVNVTYDPYRSIFVDSRISYQDTPLIHAAANDNLLKVNILLSHPNIDVNLLVGKDQQTALEVSLLLNNVEIFKSLLNHPKINLVCNFVPILIYTTMHYRTIDLYLKFILILIAHPKINVNATNNFGNTSLHLACCYNSISIVKLLLSHPDIDVNIRNLYGQLPDDMLKGLCSNLIKKFRLEHTKND